MHTQRGARDRKKGSREEGEGRRDDGERWKGREGGTTLLSSCLTPTETSYGLLGTEEVGVGYLSIPKLVRSKPVLILQEKK